MTPGRRLAPVLPGVLVFLVAALAFSRVGAEAHFVHDEGVYVYGGQRMLEGVPPYVSIFDAKAPFGTVLCAAGIAAGRLIGLDDLTAARALFFLLSCLAVVALYYLALVLFESPWQAALTSVLLIGFREFGAHAMAGPLPKSAAVLFVTAALALTAGRRWFPAGVAAGLAAVTWQPTGIYPIVVVLLAWFQAGERGRWRAAARGLAGALLPAVALVLFFAAQGSLFALLDGSFLYPALFHDAPQSAVVHLRRMLAATLKPFGGMGFAIALGLVMMGPLYLWRARAGASDARTGVVRALLGDRFAGLLISFPAPLLWSLRDFQNYPDLFILLPYAALGFGWLLYLGLGALADLLDRPGGGRDGLAATTAAFLLVLATSHYWDIRPREQLSWQRDEMARLLDTYGDAARIVSIGAPEALALLGRENPSRYGLRLRPGIVAHIDARENGGFRGWLESLSGSGPDVVLVHPGTRDGLDEDHGAIWDEWINGYVRRPQIGGFDVYVPATG